MIYTITISHSIKAYVQIEADDLDSAKELALEKYRTTPTDQLDFDWEQDEEVIDYSEEEE